MAFLAARRSANRRFVYFETDDYVVQASRLRLWSLFVKRPPFVSGTYLDELALAAALCPPGAPLWVLGGSCGSTFPLALSCTPGLRLISVDSDPDAARAGRHFIDQVLPASSAKAITWLEQPAETSALDGAGATFVDLYTEDEISPIAVDPRLHRDAPITLINIFDPGFEPHAECATTAAIHALSAFYRSFLVLRRRETSMLIGARLEPPVLRGRVRHAQERISAACVTPARIIEDVSAIAPVRSLKELFTLGPPSAAVEPDDSSFAVDARRELARLGASEILGLLRQPSSFLDF